MLFFYIMFFKNIYFSKFLGIWMCNLNIKNNYRDIPHVKPKQDKKSKGKYFRLFSVS